MILFTIVALRNKACDLFANIHKVIHNLKRQFIIILNLFAIHSFKNYVVCEM